jgi:hypothetical protein
MDIPSGFKFISYDGDSVGRRIGRATMADDLDELRHISELIKAGHELVRRWVKDNNGVWINGGGDEGVAAIPGDCIEKLEQLRKDYEYLVGHTISVGVGDKPSESGRALLMAKLAGKNRIVKFSRAIEKEVVKIKKRAKKGAFKSMEEHKLAEAYLKKAENDDPNSIANQKPEATHENCEWCNQTDGVDLDHCTYCHDQEREEKCPYCSYDRPVDEKLDFPELAEQDCQYCKEKDAEEQNECKYCNDPGKNDIDGSTLPGQRIGTSPDSTNEAAPAGSADEKELYSRMDMAPPEIGKPLPPDKRVPIGQNAPMDVVPKTPEQEDSRSTEKDADMGEPPAIDPEDNHSKEAMQAIAKEIETDGNPTDKEVNAVDDAAMPTSKEAEGNISRPSGFAQNTPGDMGEDGTNPPTSDEPAGEEDPDYYGVLEAGLDEHANGIKKEKSIQMVSQALMQFKAAKQTLENIREQAPDLYSASISMLKAMIEMAGMLGLNSAASAQPQQELGAEQAELVPNQPESNEKPPEEQNDEWHDPFPTHPDQGGEAKPTHSPSKNNPAPHRDMGSALKDSPKSVGGSIGQPAGKLSSQHTTEHVARIPTPPGAINSKGQQKVIDPKTGKTRWIDRKAGMVQSATGVPIKSPNRNPQSGSQN